MMTEPKKTAVKKDFIHHSCWISSTYFLLELILLPALISLALSAKIACNLSHISGYRFNCNSY